MPSRATARFRARSSGTRSTSGRGHLPIRSGLPSRGAAILTLPAIWNSTAYFAVTSDLGHRALHRLRDPDLPATVGRRRVSCVARGTWVGGAGQSASIATIWVAFIVILFVLPPANPITPAHLQLLDRRGRGGCAVRRSVLGGVRPELVQRPTRPGLAGGARRPSNGNSARSGPRAADASRWDGSTGRLR